MCVGRIPGGRLKVGLPGSGQSTIR